MKKVILTCLLIAIGFFQKNVLLDDEISIQDFEKAKRIKEDIYRLEEELETSLKAENARIKEELELQDKHKRFLDEMAELDNIEDKQEWFVEYKNLIFRYSDVNEIPETVWDVYEKDDVLLICRVVETECYGKDFESKANVASVIFNRINANGVFGKTVNEVITASDPKQFTYWRKEISHDTMNAVMYAFEIGDTTDGCLYFHSNNKTDTFSKAKYQFTDDAGHHFYKPVEE